MDLVRAPYFLILQVGTKEQFYEKLRIEKKRLKDIRNMKDERNISLLSHCLACRQYELSRKLLDLGAEVNVVSTESCNEIHHLAVRMGNEETLELAQELVRRGVDLDLKDKRYKNTAFFYLCQAAMTIYGAQWYPLIRQCMKKKPDIKWKNVAGYSVESAVRERGSAELLAIILGEGDTHE